MIRHAFKLLCALSNLVLIVAVAGMFIARHIKLLNGIPRDISRRLYTMTSKDTTGPLENTIREKVNWTRFLIVITIELTYHGS